MENRQTLGPRADPAPVPPQLSRARRSLLLTLRDLAGPTTLAALAELTGLHENTVRGHLEGLAGAGLVTRSRAEPDGRGRPAWLWRAAPPGDHRSEYAGLAAALARTLHRTSEDPLRDATAAGEEWGRDLVAARQPDAPGPARDPVVGLLDELGFGPEPGVEGQVRLTRCPLLEAARQHPEIVCNVHQGLVTGALEASGDPATSAELRPFAEPGACLLLLETAER